MTSFRVVSGPTRIISPWRELFQGPPQSPADSGVRPSPAGTSITSRGVQCNDVADAVDLAQVPGAVVNLDPRRARLRAVDDEAALVARSLAGDHDAYAVLVRRHQGIALRVAGLLAPHGEAEDACQDAFVKAYRALGRFDAARPFCNWLLAIVANEARSRGRGKRRVARLLERAATHAPVDAGSAEERALARVGAGPLVAALQSLREDEQLTLAFRFVLDLSEDETAALLGCARGTVKSRTSRALARLRDALEEPT